MLLAITFLLLLITGYYAWKKPDVAIALILVFLPVFLIRWPGFNTLDLLVVGATMIIFFHQRHSLKKILNQNKSLVIILAISPSVATLALLFPPHGFSGLGILKSYFFIPFLFNLILILIIKNKNDLTTLLTGIVCLSLLISLTALIQIYFPQGLGGLLAIPNPSWQPPNPLRVTGLLEYPNALALLLGPLIPLVATFYYLTPNKKLKILAGLTTFTSLTTIWFAQSKGGLLALALTLIIILGYYFHKKIILVSLFLLTFFVITVPNFNTLISHLGPNSYSAQLRFIGWEETLAFLKNNYLFGAGLANYQTTIIPYHQQNYLEIFLYPHNIFLNFWVELGLIGLVYFTGLFLYGIYQNTLLTKSNLPIAKVLGLAGLSSLLIILIHGLVDVPYFKNDLAIIFWLIFLWPLISQKIFVEETNI